MVSIFWHGPLCLPGVLSVFFRFSCWSAAGGCCQLVSGVGYAGSRGPLRGPDTSWPRRDAATRHKYQVPVKRSFLKPRLHARVEQIVLNCNVFKTLFRSARLGHARGTSHARGLHGLTFPGPRPHADDPRPCGRGLRCMGRLFGSTVKRAPNIRIRWRPPSAHQAAAAAGRAIGAPHRYHRSAPSQCSTA